MNTSFLFKKSKIYFVLAILCALFILGGLFIYLLSVKIMLPIAETKTQKEIIQSQLKNLEKNSPSPSSEETIQSQLKNLEKNSPSPSSEEIIQSQLNELKNNN